MRQGRSLGRRRPAGIVAEVRFREPCFANPTREATMTGPGVAATRSESWRSAWRVRQRLDSGSHDLDSCDVFFLDSALQDEIHHVVIFRFVFDLQTFGEVDQTDLDLLDYRIPLEHAARHFIRHCR